MRRVPYSPRHIGGLVFLTIAWMTWLHATVSDPKFLCVEAANDIRLESVSSGCCGLEVSPAALPDAELNGDDCHGCEDLALHFVATSHRPGLEQYTGDLAAVTVVPPGLLPDAGTLLRGTGTARVFMPHAVLQDDPLHVLPGAAPLIC